MTQRQCEHSKTYGRSQRGKAATQRGRAKLVRNHHEDACQGGAYRRPGHKTDFFTQKEPAKQSGKKGAVANSNSAFATEIFWIE